MIQVQFSHLDYNVSDLQEARTFYDPLMEVLGLACEYAHPDVVLYGNLTFKFCLVQVEERYREAGFHRKRPGLNHIAFSVKAREDVDRLYQEYLLPRGITVLYGGPGQFANNIEYYAVFFEDPYRLKVEVVYAPHYLNTSR
jgi:catechol 2,3-dioxygenase-like lactoylglutathione lyase family enzyme